MLKNILANWSYIFVSAAAVFLLYPYFVGLLGEEQYGVWLLISSITGYFSLIQMGVPLTNVRYISKYYATGEFEKLNEILGANLSLFTVMAVLTMLIGTILSLVLDSVFQISDKYIEYARAAMLIATFEIAVRFVFEAAEGVLQARREFIFINLVRNIIVVLRVSLSFLLVTRDFGLVWISLLLLFSTIIQSVFFYTFIKRKYPKLNLWPRKFSKSIFFEIFSYSIFVLLLQVASRISFQTDALVLASIVSVASVVWFGVANSILLYLTQLIVSISKVIMPKISELSALGKDEEIRNEYLHSARLTGLLVMPICLGIHLYGGDFIQLWMGENYRPEMKNVLSILVLGYAFFLVQRATGFPVMMGISKMKWPTIIMFGGAIVNLFLSLWWGRSYGIDGVAWGTTIPIICVSVALLFYTARILKISVLKVALESIAIPALALLPLFASYFLLSRWVKINSFAQLFLSVSVVSVFCLMGICFLLSQKDRAKLFSVLRFKG